VPILFFANKSDSNTAKAAQDIADQMELNNITDRPWQIQASSAMTGMGVQEGMDWLAEMLKRD
jgi:signal recognition particle receptor subunit beta